MSWPYCRCRHRGAAATLCAFGTPAGALHEGWQASRFCEEGRKLSSTSHYREGRERKPGYSRRIASWNFARPSRSNYPSKDVRLVRRRNRSNLMTVVAPERRAVLLSMSQAWGRDAELGLNNLLIHRTRSLLTMLGMIFGVAAVVAMLSIGAGARQKVMALIEQMGVRNLIVEAKETLDWQAHTKVRKTSPG